MSKRLPSSQTLLITKSISSAYHPITRTIKNLYNGRRGPQQSISPAINHPVPFGFSPRITHP